MEHKRLGRMSILVGGPHGGDGAIRVMVHICPACSAVELVPADGKIHVWNITRGAMCNPPQPLIYGYTGTREP